MQVYRFSSKNLQHDFRAEIAILIFVYLIFIWEISANI